MIATAGPGAVERRGMVVGDAARPAAGGGSPATAMSPPRLTSTPQLRSPPRPPARRGRRPAPWRSRRGRARRRAGRERLRRSSSSSIVPPAGGRLDDAARTASRRAPDEREGAVVAGSAHAAPTVGSTSPPVLGRARARRARPPAAAPAHLDLAPGRARSRGRARSPSRKRLQARSISSSSRTSTARAGSSRPGRSPRPSRSFRAPGNEARRDHEPPETTTGAECRGRGLLRCGRGGVAASAAQRCSRRRRDVSAREGDRAGLRDRFPRLGSEAAATPATTPVERARTSDRADGQPTKPGSRRIAREDCIAARVWRGLHPPLSDHRAR